MDYNSAQWLSDQWATTARLEMNRPEWDELMKKVGIMLYDDNLPEEVVSIWRLTETSCEQS